MLKEIFLALRFALAVTAPVDLALWLAYKHDRVPEILLGLIVVSIVTLVIVWPRYGATVYRKGSKSP